MLLEVSQPGMNHPLLDAVLVLQDCCVKSFHLPEIEPSPILPLTQRPPIDPMNFLIFQIVAPPKSIDGDFDRLAKSH